MDTLSNSTVISDKTSVLGNVSAIALSGHYVTTSYQTLSKVLELFHLCMMQLHLKPGRFLNYSTGF